MIIKYNDNQMYKCVLLQAYYIYSVLFTTSRLYTTWHPLHYSAEYLAWRGIQKGLCCRDVILDFLFGFPLFAVCWRIRSVNSLPSRRPWKIWWPPLTLPSPSSLRTSTWVSRAASGPTTSAPGPSLLGTLEAWSVWKASLPSVGRTSLKNYNL